MKKALLVMVIAVAPLVLMAQLVSPHIGGVYITPTNIPIQLTNGCLIHQVVAYKYRIDTAGAEHLEYCKSGPLMQDTTNQFALNPDSGNWLLFCGDYSFKVIYSLDGSNYQAVMTEKVRVLTDRATIIVRYPSIRSVLVRGDVVTIKWDAITKPGNEGMVLSLVTPDGDSGFSVAELGINGDTLVTNQFTWTVVTNTSYWEGAVSVSDGTYGLQVIPASSYGMGSTSFQIDSEQTIPPTLETTNTGRQLAVIVGVHQAMGRFWSLQSSTNLTDWFDMTNTPVWQGGVFSVPQDLGHQFFRSKVVP